MSCARMEGKILGYVDGRLKESERLEVEKHLGSCAACRLRANEFRAVSGLLDELPVIEPSAAFDLRVHARVAAEPVKQSWWAWFAPSPRVAFAASMLLLATVWRAQTQPYRRQEQHRSRKRHTRRWRKPRPPTLLHRLRGHSRVHAQIKRHRRLDHRQLIQQTAHRAKLIRAQPARRATPEMLLDLEPFALLQAPVHVSQNFAFHPSTAHDFPSFSTQGLLLQLLRHEGGKFHPQRFVGPEEQRFQRALRALQNLRNLAVIQLLILVQKNGRALLIRKLLDR